MRIDRVAAACIAGPILTAVLVTAPRRHPADPVASASRSIDPERAQTVSQAAVGRVLRPHRLIDMYGRPFDLDELRGRPLVVSLVYTSCTSVVRSPRSA
jgi:protein SCO1/2